MYYRLVSCSRIQRVYASRIQRVLSYDNPTCIIILLWHNGKNTMCIILRWQGIRLQRVLAYGIVTVEYPTCIIL